MIERYTNTVTLTITQGPQSMDVDDATERKRPKEATLYQNKKQFRRAVVVVVDSVVVVVVVVPSAVADDDIVDVRRRTRLTHDCDVIAASSMAETVTAASPVGQNSLHIGQ